MLRHLGATKGGSNSPANRAQSPMSYDEGAADSVFSNSSGSVIYKKSRLNQKQRINLRTAMLGFLEGTRDEESSLVCLP